MKTISKILCVVLALTLVLGFAMFASAATVSKTYVISDYTAGTQYASDEKHVLDDNVTVYTTKCHFTTEIRIYSSSTNNGYVIIESKNVLTGFDFNAGNKVDTLKVYGSTNGSSYTLIQDVSITSTSYKDYSVTIPASAGYKYLKLDVAGTNQVRIMNFTVKYEGACDHTDTTYNVTATNHTLVCTCGEVLGQATPHSTDAVCVCGYVNFLKTGDQVVIYNPASNKAFSSELTAADSYYQKGVDVTLSGGKLTGYGDTEIWTVTVNSDGTVSFEQGGKKIAMGTDYASMTLGEVNNKWTLAAAGDGVYTVRNAARGNYMQWYASKGNWSTYTNSNAASDPNYQLAFYVIPVCEHPNMTWEKDETGHWQECECGHTTTKANHDGSDPCGVCGYDVPCTHPETELSWKSDESGHWQECSCGEYSTDKADHDGSDPCGVCGFDVPEVPCEHPSMTWDHDETGHWQECTCGHSTTKADHDGSDPCGVCGYDVPCKHPESELTWDHSDTQHWQDCSCGEYSTTKEAHDGNATCKCGYVAPPADDEEEDEHKLPFKNGDKIVIYNPANNKALSSLPSSEGSFYQKGVDVVLSGKKLTGYGETEIWTVVIHDDGSVSFEQDGQKIAMGTQYSSMKLGEVNDKWEIGVADDGTYTIKNVARDNYMEWYASKSNWSTYTSSNVASDPLFMMSFYVVSSNPGTGDTTSLIPAVIIAVLSVTGMALVIKKK